MSEQKLGPAQATHFCQRCGEPHWLPEFAGKVAWMSCSRCARLHEPPPTTGSGNDEEDA